MNLILKATKYPREVFVVGFRLLFGGAERGGSNPLLPPLWRRGLSLTSPEIQGPFWIFY